MTLEQAAVELASRGYHVFPVRERGKEPLTSTGFKDATRDEQQILHWWTRYPGANIGVACGASGVVVLDIDSKAGADPDEVIGQLAERGCDVDGAAVTRTGEAPEPDASHPRSLAGVRGAHVVWRGEMTTTNDLAIDGAELRGNGAYVVAAPSVHPSGVAYTGVLPRVAELPPAPQWLRGLVKPSSGRNGSSPAPDVITKDRNIALTKIAGSLRRPGLTEAELLAALLAVNAERCRPPLDKSEVAKIAESVAKYPPGQRPPSELTDFTVPDNILEELREKGISEEDIEGADNLKELMKLLGGAKESVATRIVKLVLDAGVELFHDDAERTFATFAVGGHAETWPLGSQAFRRYARRLFYEAHETAPGGQGVTDALGVLEAKAQFEGPELPVHVRVAGDATRIVIDLGDSQWRAIEITGQGWRLLADHPVKFRRTGGMVELPVPAAGGTVDLLRPFLNVADDDAWRLVVAWLLAALRPGYPYPVLIAHGEQGSAKSTLGRVLRMLVDPSTSPLRVAPHDVDDLMVSATSSWVVAYDNVSRIPPSLSDALCRLSTGGGLSKRQLYTDSEEVLLDAMRPVILNGIDEVAHRSDLLDRALLIDMPVIPERERRSEEAFWAEFTAVHAQVLGALCDALVSALAHVTSVRLERLPRMADFARWVTAAAPALGWDEDAFLDAYNGNRSQAHEVAIETSPIGPALLKVADVGFTGTMSELLAALEEKVTDQATKAKDWPTSARGVRADLDRLAPNMRALGYELAHTREGHKRTRIVVVRKQAT